MRKVANPKQADGVNPKTRLEAKQLENIRGGRGAGYDPNGLPGDNH